jgi:CubicO group peptidase (beta-lactamase class C family)
MTTGKFAFALSLLLLAASGAQARTPRPRVDPVKAGLDPAKLAPLRAELQKFVDGRKVSGAIAVIGRKGHLASFEVVGQRDAESAKPMEVDTLFRIASMTKIVTAVAVMLLEEEGKLSVDDPVEKHLPEFRGQKLIKSRTDDTMMLADPERPIRVRDLLTHTSGMQCALPAGFADLGSKRNRSLAEAVVAFSQHPLAEPPGTVWRYCGPAFDTLGRVVEVASGKPFHAFLEQRIFRPLGMKDTTFRPNPAQRARLAVIYGNENEAIKRSEKQGYPAEDVVFESAGGGLFSTAPDYLRFAQMLAGGGSLGKTRILRPETLARMTSVHFSSDKKVGFTPGLGMGLGVQVVMKPQGITALMSEGSFGHGGAYGTHAWIDPKNEMVYLLMIQREGWKDGDMSDLRKTLQEIGGAALSPRTATAPAP